MSTRAHILHAYLQGAIHDGTFSRRHRSWRIAQSNITWLELLRQLLAELGHRGWIYREGKNRSVSVLETTAKFLSAEFDPLTMPSCDEQLAYVRGVFDAEGGFPRSASHWLYIQFGLINRPRLIAIRSLLEANGIECGVIHVPSKRAQPDYYRFYVCRSSHQAFMVKVGSWHPRKAALIAQRMKI